MSAEPQVRTQENTYGNLTRPTSTGLFGMPLAVTGLAAFMIVFCMILIGFGHVGVALIIAAVSIVLMGLSRGPKKEGRTIYGRLMLRVGHRSKVATSKHLYLSGPAGFTPTGDTRLPGLMARSELSEHTDSFGRSFGLLRLAGRGHYNYSIMIEAFPEGRSVYDQEQMNRKVAHWASWLTHRGLDETVRGASVTIETSPDAGLRLPAMLAANADPDAPQYVKDTMAEIEEVTNVGAPQLGAYISITFDGAEPGSKGKDRGVAEMAEEIGVKLPSILSDLSVAGGGAVHVCTAQEITDMTRTWYDPTTATEIEEAQAAGGTQLRWEDAGPSFAADAFEYYRHDRAYSKTWEMYEGPHGAFTADSLARATQPAKHALRKRVTLLYRPIPVDETTAKVEAEQRNASLEGSQKRTSARASQRLANARKSAQEEALGAGLTRFGVIVTVSVDSPEKLREFDRSVPGSMAQAKLRMRVARGNQAVAFQAGLPLGLVLADQMIIPEELRAAF